MSRFSSKEYSLVIGVFIGLLLFPLIQWSSRIFLKEGIITFWISRSLGLTAPVESATTTPAIVPPPDRRRPLAVMIDNHPNALPQSGLSKADAVWEVLVEGGLTRYLAIFKSRPADEIGPVRSARPYFLDWAREADAVYVHVGGSDEALHLLAAGAAGLDDANEFSNGSTYWRDRAKVAPHNVYTSTEKLRALTAKKGWREETDVQDATLRSDIVPDGESASAVDIAFARGGQQVEFRYDAATQAYDRVLSGRPAKDAGGAIAPRTVVVLEIDAVKGKDPQGKGLLAMKTAGSGKAVVFRNGVAVKGVWKKTSAEDPLQVYAEDKKIPFSSGQVWYAVIAPNRGGAFSYR